MRGFSPVCSARLLSIIRPQRLSPEFNKDLCCQAVKQHNHPQASGQGPQPWPASYHSSLSSYPCLCSLIFSADRSRLEKRNPVTMEPRSNSPKAARCLFANHNFWVVVMPCIIYSSVAVLLLTPPFAPASNRSNG